MNTYDLLKDNKTPWKWLDDMEKVILLRTKQYNAMVFMDKNGYWQKHKGDESMGVVYRVYKDYREKASYPEIPPRVGGESSANSKAIDCLYSIYERLEKLEKDRLQGCLK